ncbi:MAG: transcription-repair coupling factor, partial [Actinobacteria bacterium]|nr:transcription-repair coupling factor [Actinomycetota bacterium]
MLNLFNKLLDPVTEYLELNENLIAPSAIHSLLAATAKSPLLVVTTSTRHSEELAAEISSLIGSDQVINFPAWETLPHERLSPKADTVTARFRALDKIISNQTKIVVCSIRALLQPIISNDLDASKIRIKSNSTFNMSELITLLIKFGFTRSDLVERRGEFAVRGGILDLFPADQEHPIRIDFFGDEIDELNYFSISDQRSMDKILNEIVIYPCRELLIDDNLKQKAQELGNNFPEISELTEKIAAGIYFEGIESLAAGLVESFKMLTDYLSNASQIWLVDEPRIRSRSLDLVETNNEFLQAAWSNIGWSNAQAISAPIELSNKLGVGGFYQLDEIKAHSAIKNHSWRTLNKYVSTPEDSKLNFVEEIESYENKYENALRDISQWQ